jgi:hypothetical protein
MNQRVLTTADAAALAFVTAQAYRVNSTVLAQPYPQWAFNELIFVETEGNPWAAGVITYMTDFVGKAEFITGYAKDMPFADVNQDFMTRSFHMAGIGYQWNIEEVNTTLNIVGGTLPSRRASACRQIYQKFMWDTTLFGQAEKGLYGLTNTPQVPAQAAASDGDGGVPFWVNSAGEGTKTPDQIVRDFNIALTGVSNATFGQILADTVLLPEDALLYISGTPYSTTNTMDTILSFIQRNNLYTLKTGRQLKIRSLRELNSAGTVGAGAGEGRMVAYYDDPTFVKLHLPMPHQFLPVLPDGWANFVVPGIFRTGGVEFLAPSTAFYLDGVSED